MRYRREIVRNTIIGRAFFLAATEVGPPSQMSRLRGGPRAKMTKVAASGGGVEQIHKIEDIMKGRELGLKCVASGMRFWGAFRDTSGRPHFPPRKEAAIARSAYFSAGRIAQ